MVCEIVGIGTALLQWGAAVVIFAMGFGFCGLLMISRRAVEQREMMNAVADWDRRESIEQDMRQRKSRGDISASRTDRFSGPC